MAGNSQMPRTAKSRAGARPRPGRKRAGNGGAQSDVLDDEIALFEAVQEMHQPGALDPEPLGDRHLAQAWIGADDGQDGILRRPDIDGAERANKILKNPDLEAPHRITGVAGQRVEGDRVVHDAALRAAVSRSEEHTSELQSHGTISYAVSLDRKSVV